MYDVAVIGAGKIGSTIAQFLAASGDYCVTVMDRSSAQLERVDGDQPLKRLKVDVEDIGALTPALAGRFAVVSAAPFHLTTRVAEAARGAGAHYFDLTEDVASSRVVQALASSSHGAFVPQCGLAPGFVTIVANSLAKGFEQLDEVRLRVGALPQFPSNALNYNITWSIEGVINEYCEPCEAIVEGEVRETMALQECERFALDGVVYEAFNTSGGLGTLCASLQGQVRTLNYRTIRYPGHAAIMKTLLDDLGLRRRRDLLKDILETALPATLQDVVIVFVTVCGIKAGRLVQETWSRKIYASEMGGVVRSAIQITTAAGVCAALDLVAGGALPQRGLIRQEDIPLSDFLENRFGRFYLDSAAGFERLAADRCSAERAIRIRLPA